MKIEKDPLNLIIAGVGGQGNVLASHIIAYAGIQDGFFVTVGETYGASQRGGSVMSHVRLSSITQRGPLVPEGQADVIMGLEPAETLRVIADFGNPNTRVIMNPRPVYPIWVLSGLAEYPSVEDIINRLEKLAKGVN
ncbi:MAG: indolepyruvate ferredoxin oxidoreductase, partial [Desulfobacterales bacterium]|nr:indolepyruvate ferredoxin oxidoreductase [Desulfobacterales bacterium]